MTYEEITERYGKGYLTDKQLDGAGAAEGDPEITENCVTVGWISQEQAEILIFRPFEFKCNPLFGSLSI